jgi:hypothetical protein
MNPRQTLPRWIITWEDDSGDEDHDIRETADSADEARKATKRILSGVTCTPEEADEIGGDRTEPAYTVLVRDVFTGDIVTGLLSLGDERAVRRCDSGTSTVERER